MGRVQQFAREGKPLPPGCAVDMQGRETTDPAQVAALLPFGGHKGYGLSLIDELAAAFIGGSLPTLRNRWGQGPEDEKRTTCFYFECIRPEALSCGGFAKGRTQADNVKAVLDDILGHGNAPPEGRTMLPGRLEHEAALRTDRAGGLIFTDAEIAEFANIAKEAGVRFTPAALQPAPA